MNIDILLLMNIDILLKNTEVLDILVLNIDILVTCKKLIYFFRIWYNTDILVTCKNIDILLSDIDILVTQNR